MVSYLDGGGTQHLISKLLDTMYPVGSIYISMYITSPASFFGGEWERVGQGQALFGVDEGNTKFASSGLTGGASSATVNGTNFRTQIRFESNGKFFFSQDESSPQWNSTSSVTGLSYDWATGLWGTKTGVRCGGTQTINTIPPYFTAFMWQRIK